MKTYKEEVLLDFAEWIKMDRFSYYPIGDYWLDDENLFNGCGNYKHITTKELFKLFLNENKIDPIKDYDQGYEDGWNEATSIAIQDSHKYQGKLKERKDEG